MQSTNLINDQRTIKYYWGFIGLIAVQKTEEDELENRRSSEKRIGFSTCLHCSRIFKYIADELEQYLNQIDHYFSMNYRTM